MIIAAERKAYMNTEGKLGFKPLFPEWLAHEKNDHWREMIPAF